MRRVKIIIEYDGTGLLGWQIQKEGDTVQSLLEKAVYGFSGEQVKMVAAGRTDAGVHALGQVAHFDLEKAMNPDKIRDAINAHLKNSRIVVLKADEVSSDFHARFSAKWRKYIYKITNRRAPLALDLNHSWWVPVFLDENKMREGAEYLIGNHDFSSFRAAACQAKTPVKTIDYIDIKRDKNEIVIEIKAKSFLHHMVRNIVGTLKAVGAGKILPDDVKKILDAKDRKQAFATAPADGLFFVEVGY